MQIPGINENTIEGMKPSRIDFCRYEMKGIRYGVCADTARIIRQHNDVNMLSIGARVAGVKLALDIVDAFLSALFEGGRHSTRGPMIDAQAG